MRAARDQRCCARCGGAGEFEAHHVVERRYLKANKLPQFVSVNALRLCPSCHAAHTNRSQPLHLSHLTDDNIEYAFTVLGNYAYTYLKSLYDGEDERVDLAMEESSGTPRESIG